MEVLLCSGWTWAADNFSLGCIFCEVYTGNPLFECARFCDNDEQHLQAMERRLGSVPKWLADAAVGRGRNLVHAATRFGNVRASPFAAADRSSPLSERIQDRDLCDMLLRLLDYDPQQRLRSDEVAHHPFVTQLLGRSNAALCTYPPNAMSAGRVALPPGGKQRPAADRLRGQIVPETPRSGRSMSARPGAKNRGDPLRDVTNRVPQQQQQQPLRDAAVNCQPAANGQQGRQPRGSDVACGPRPRSCSAAAGTRGLALRPSAAVCGGLEPWRRPAAGQYTSRGLW